MQCDDDKWLITILLVRPGHCGITCCLLFLSIWQPLDLMVQIRHQHHFWLTLLECIVPLIASSLHRCRFSAMLTVSLNVSLWDLRSSRTILIQVVWGPPGGLYRSSSGDAVEIFFTSALHSIHALCPNREKCRACVSKCGWVVQIATALWYLKLSLPFGADLSEVEMSDWLTWLELLITSTV